MVNLALLGAGRWGQNYLKEAEKIHDLRIKYVIASTNKRLQNLSNQYIKLTNYKQILNDKTLDGVIVATPASTHFKLAKEFINKGFNVLLEKPYAMGEKEANELLDLSLKKKSIVLVGHLQLYNPAFLKIIEIIEDIGNILIIDFQAHSSPKRDDCPVIWDWGPHFVSMCLEITKDLPERISSKISKEKAYIQFNYSNGAVAIADLDRSDKKRRRIMTILGENGLIMFNEDAAKKIFHLQFFPSLKLNYPNYSKKTPLFLELQEFVKSIRKKGEPRTNLQNGKVLTELLDRVEALNPDAL